MKLNLQKYRRLLEIVDVDKTGHVTYRKTGKPVPVFENPKTHYLQGIVWDSMSCKNLNFTVHTLVAVRWLGDPPEGKEQVSHLDETQQNNRVENLVWASTKENSRMPLRRKRCSAAHPFEKCSAAHEKFKKKVAQYTLSGELVAEHESVNAAARAVGGNPGGISSVCRGRQPTYYGYCWDWA